MIYFPKLSASKTTRCVTKHYINAGIYMDSSEYALLSWLVYECSMDNTFTYNAELLDRYRHTVIFAIKEYRTTKRVNVSLNAIRQDFKALVLSGCVVRLGDRKLFILNPMLSYSYNYISARKYAKFMEDYNINSLKAIEQYVK